MALEFSLLVIIVAALVVVLLMLVIRPFAIILSTVGTNFNFWERVFMSFFGPRGIVIAATGVFIAIHIGFTLWALLPSNSRFYLSHSTDYCHHPSRFRSLYGKSV